MVAAEQSPEKKQHPFKDLSLPEREGVLIHLQTQKMESGEDKAQLLLPEKHINVEGLPLLRSKTRFTRDAEIRIDILTGELYMSRWDRPKTIIDPETNKKVVTAPERFAKTESQSKYTDPNKLFKTKPVVNKVYSNYSSLEAAIRASLRVAEGVDKTNESSEPLRLMKVALLSDEIKDSFNGRSPSEEERSEFASRTEALIEDLRLDNTNDESKQKIAHQLRSILSQNSPYQKNALVSLTKLLSADLAIHHRLVETDFIYRKFSANYLELTAERDSIRYKMRRGIQMLEDLEYRISLGSFDQTKIVNELRNIATTKFNARPKPYGPDCLIINSLLVGIDEKLYKRYEKTFREGSLDYFLSITPATKSLESLRNKGLMELTQDQKSPEDRRQDALGKIRWAIGHAYDSLESPENNNLTPSTPEERKARQAEEKRLRQLQKDSSQIFPAQSAQ